MSRPTRKKGPDKVFLFGGAILILLISLYLLMQFLTKPDCAVDFIFGEIDGGNMEVGRTIQFTDNTPGEVETRFWDFGDGQTSNEVAPQHSYDRPGSFTVTLTINDECSVQKQIEILPPSEEMIVLPTLPTAVIEGPTEAFVGEIVQFYDRTPNSVERTWFFPDSDEPVTEQNPSHVFNVAMKYVVTLEVKGFESARHEILIKQKKEVTPKPQKTGGSGGQAPGGGSPPPPAPVKKELTPSEFVKAFKDELANSRSLAINAIGEFFGGTFKNCKVKCPDGTEISLLALQMEMRANKKLEASHKVNLNTNAIRFEKDSFGNINKIILTSK